LKSKSLFVKEKQQSQQPSPSQQPQQQINTKQITINPNNNNNNKPTINNVVIPLVAFTKNNQILHQKPIVVQQSFGENIISISNENHSIQEAPISNQTKIVASTNVNVIYTKYRVVISLDVSPSMATLNSLTGELPFDHILTVLRNLVESLCKPIHVGSFIVRIWLLLRMDNFWNLILILIFSFWDFFFFFLLFYLFIFVYFCYLFI